MTRVCYFDHYLPSDIKKSTILYCFLLSTNHSYIVQASHIAHYWYNSREQISLYTMNEELKQLLEWFDNYEITFNEIRLSPCQYIFDLRKFISVQTNSIRRNWDNPTFEYDILSLYQLKKVLEEKEKENKE